MNYRHLPRQLWPAAEVAENFFKNHWGVSRFKAETEIDPDAEYRPTLHAPMPDHHYLCIEVSESPCPRGLEGHVVECINHSLPVRLFVVFPAGPKGRNYDLDLRRARDLGVGVVEIRRGRGKMLHGAVSLSLAGLRKFNTRHFPRRYRFSVSQAELTFRGGNPSKGCAELYDEIEALSRKLAKLTFQEGLWKKPPPGKKLPKIKFEKYPWDKLMGTLVQSLNFQKCKAVTQNLVVRIWGLADPRNQSAHKVTSRKTLINRDMQLRTRFENAADILLDLATAMRKRP